MFYQVCVPSPETDALRFLWSKGTDREIEDYPMRVHIFGKRDSLLNEQHLRMIIS